MYYCMYKNKLLGNSFYFYSFYYYFTFLFEEKYGNIDLCLTYLKVIFIALFL